MAAAVDMTGPIIGAINMAPMTTAAESDNRPQQAIIVDTMSKTAMRFRKGL